MMRKIEYPTGEWVVCKICGLPVWKNKSNRWKHATQEGARKRHKAEPRWLVPKGTKDVVV